MLAWSCCCLAFRYVLAVHMPACCLQAAAWREVPHPASDQATRSTRLNALLKLHCLPAGHAPEKHRHTYGPSAHCHQADPRCRCTLQGMLLVKQMALTDTQASASRVSLLTIGQQAIMDAYLCLLHLTTGKL